MTNKKAQNPFIFLFFVVFIIALVGFGVFMYTEFKRTNEPVSIQFDDNISRNYSQFYPDRKVVTGGILERDKTIICKTGYSSTVRNVPLSLRKKVFARDGVDYPQPYGTYELDHWLPLCLGGSNEESNLFVQFEPYYKWKDRVEVYLCKELCRTNQSVDEVAEKMWSWYEIYLNISNNS